MKIRIVEGERTIVVDFEDVEEPGLEFEVVGSTYTRRLERDPALEAVRKILGNR